MLTDPIEVAGLILEDGPHPVVEWRLRNEVLRLPECDTDAASTLAGLKSSRHYLELKDEQLKDGGWGRMHSMDTSHKHTIPTTEYAVARAAALGLDRNDEVMKGAAEYLAGLLSGRYEFPDPPEANDRWETGTQLFAASTLALIDPDHPAIDPVFNNWATIAERTFASGEHDPEAEIDAQRELHGIRSDLRYLKIQNRYTAALLGSRSTDLPEQVSTAYQRWLWTLPGGLGYLEADMSKPPELMKSGPTERWLYSLELLSLFAGWTQYGGHALDWLWGTQFENGIWDFGPRSSTSHVLPLSEDWKMAARRRHDWTARVLCLLVAAG